MFYVDGRSCDTTVPLFLLGLWCLTPLSTIFQLYRQSKRGLGLVCISFSKSNKTIVKRDKIDSSQIYDRSLSCIVTGD
jgi:hypothetical protein